MKHVSVSARCASQIKVTIEEFKRRSRERTSISTRHVNSRRSCDAYVCDRRSTSPRNRMGHRQLHRSSTIRVVHVPCSCIANAYGLFPFRSNVIFQAGGLSARPYSVREQAANVF